MAYLTHTGIGTEFHYTGTISLLGRLVHIWATSFKIWYAIFTEDTKFYTHSFFTIKIHYISNVMLIFISNVTFIWTCTKELFFIIFHLLPSNITELCTRVSTILSFLCTIFQIINNSILKFKVSVPNFKVSYNSIQ